MKRRSFLKAAAAVPLGAQVAAQQVAMSAAGITGIGMVQGGGAAGQCGEAASKPARQLTSFSEWLKIGGMKQVKEQAQDVRSLDPDIVCLVSVSLCAKIQMQRDRNLKRALAEREDWFLGRLKREGFVSWWGD